MKVNIFVAYSHHDRRYLQDDSLLGYLRGLESDGAAEFWYDERITTGDLWDDEIKAKIAASQIALLLVSQLFLDSPYVKKTEIRLFLEQRRDEGLVLSPVILSACDWQAHDWLRATQFLPKGDKNLESDYSKPGPRKNLFLQIRRDLGLQINRAKSTSSRAAPSASSTEQKATQRPDGPENAEWGNPFDQVVAHEIGHEEIPQLFVGEYTDFNTIKKHFDTILEGQRGTGKTHILRYLAFETQLTIWVAEKQKAGLQFFEDHGNFVGIYCRLEQGVFDRSDLDAVDSADRQDRLFEHRLSLFCLSKVLKTLDSIFEHMQMGPQVFQHLKQRLSVLLQEPQIGTCSDWEQLCNYAEQTINLRVFEEDLHLGSLLPGGTPTSFNPVLTLSGQLVPFLEFLQSILHIKSPFFLMFDDFDVLRPSQQVAVFRAASARNLSVVCFKYGIMTLGKKTILAGTERTYREGHDYDLVPLDWTGGLQTDYKKAVALITAKRLESKNWPRSIEFSSMLGRWRRGEQLRALVKEAMKVEWKNLPPGKRPKTFDNYWSKYGNAKYFQHLAKKKIHHMYVSYETIIDISSGIYRQYLETCGRVVATALAAGWRPDSGRPISARIQDDAIREYSRAMTNSLSVTAGDTTALLSGSIDITSKHMMTFLESLAELFKKRLHSDMREPEIFCISIKDPLESVPAAKGILDVAVRESILHRRSADYSPKTAGGTPLPTFILNRRLAPRWGLGVRMQGRIELSCSDVVLAADDTDAFVRQFIKEGDNLEFFSEEG